MTLSRCSIAMKPQPPAGPKPTRPSFKGPEGVGQIVKLGELIQDQEDPSPADLFPPPPSQNMDLTADGNLGAETESMPVEGQRILVLTSQPAASSQGGAASTGSQPAGREGVVTKFKKGKLIGVGASTHTVLFDSGATETLVLRRHGNGGLDFRVLDSEEVRGLKQEVGDLNQEVCNLKQKVDNLQGATTSSQEATGSGPEVQGSSTSAPTPLAESKIVPILLDEIDRLSGRSSPPSEGLEARLAGALRTKLKHAQQTAAAAPACASAAPGDSDSPPALLLALRQHLSEEDGMAAQILEKLEAAFRERDQQNEVVLADLQRHVAVAAEASSDASKFAASPGDFKLSYGSQDDFTKGLTALVGAPVANASELYAAVVREHERDQPFEIWSNQFGIMYQVTPLDECRYCLWAPHRQVARADTSGFWAAAPTRSATPAKSA